ncbi:MAG: sensor histidine kinase [Lachnospiraceae bacterium]|nr:sensor histidine kinase [Lachnospiraceae bacterium]
MCYYNNYYNMLLDTTQYQTWEWIKLGENGSYGSQMTLYDNQSYSDIKFAQNATFIQDNLYQSSDYNITKWGTVNYTDTNIPKEYSIVARINPQQPYEDFFVEWERLVNDIHYYQDDSVFVLFQFIVLFLLCVFCLIYGTTNEKEELTFLRKAPLLMYSVIFISIEVLLGAGIVGFVGIVFHEQVTFSVSNFIGIIAEIVLVILAFLLFYITNITARIKTKTLYRNSEVYYLIKPIGYCGKRITEIFRELRANTPIFWKFVIAEVILTCIQLFITMNLYRYNIDMLILFVLLYKILEVLGVMFVIYQMIELQKGAKRVACGDLLKPIDTTRMFWEFKKHGEYINQTGEGISLAVEKQLKSERFKTELITNVSHDIKTPLTSIINYVDLIKKQHITDETLCEYIEVLDRQSARLKKLIEDLMEASKASTGNLTVHLEECNADVLLSQVIGEFEEKFIQKGLQIVLNKPETQVVLQADGRHLWRVFDNLMGNIYKYAQSNTRVYINLEKTERGVKFIFKNISQSQLNISSDELLERFVRGDSSRNTEGSGLGLSIAQSLTELMEGTMHLDIDGDLFKVTLQFPIEYKKQESVDDIFEKEPQDDIFEKVEKKSDKKLEKIKKFLRKKS